MVTQPTRENLFEKKKRTAKHGRRHSSAVANYVISQQQGGVNFNPQRRNSGFPVPYPVTGYYINPNPPVCYGSPSPGNTYYMPSQSFSARTSPTGNSNLVPSSPHSLSLPSVPNQSPVIAKKRNIRQNTLQVPSFQPGYQSSTNSIPPPNNSPMSSPNTRQMRAMQQLKRQKSFEDEFGGMMSHPKPLLCEHCALSYEEMEDWRRRGSNDLMVEVSRNRSHSCHDAITERDQSDIRGNVKVTDL